MSRACMRRIASSSWRANAGNRRRYQACTRPSPVSPNLARSRRTSRRAQSARLPRAHHSSSTYTLRASLATSQSGNAAPAPCPWCSCVPLVARPRGLSAASARTSARQSSPHRASARRSSTLIATARRRVSPSAPHHENHARCTMPHRHSVTVASKSCSVSVRMPSASRSPSPAGDPASLLARRRRAVIAIVPYGRCRSNPPTPCRHRRHSPEATRGSMAASAATSVAWRRPAAPSKAASPLELATRTPTSPASPPPAPSAAMRHLCDVTRH
mmetsp:Transcript_15507/g.53875  ORF Transcript_15507/g.53875 Transcript_15507/m.53875 type:complete len:272 (+) Transcript_15507:1061-1876(+)